MKIVIAIMMIITGAFASVCNAQNATGDAAILKAFTIPVPIAGGPVWATVLTDKTVDILWRNSPSKDSLQAEAAGMGFAIYVMGLATADFELTPTYAVMQDGALHSGKAVNIRNLSGGKVTEGDILLGLIEFKDKIDPARPFTLTFSGCSVDITLSPEDVKKWGGLTSSQEGAGGPPGK